MSRLVILAGVFGVVLSFVAAAPAPGKKGTKGEPISLVALRTVVPEFEEMPVDPATKFTDVLQSLTQKMSKDHGLDIHININMRAIEEAGLNEEKILDLAPVAEKALPKMRNVTLERYLQRLLERVSEKGPIASGATLLVKRDGIEITTTKALLKQIWGDHPGPFLPLVHATMEKSLLEDALKELAEQSEYNIVLDARVGEKAKTPVTGQFLNTPLDTAVKLLADMAELSIFLQDNTIYVTTRDNAVRLETKQKRELPDDLEGKPRSRVGSGTRGYLPREDSPGGMD